MFMFDSRPKLRQLDRDGFLRVGQRDGNPASWRDQSTGKSEKPRDDGLRIHRRTRQTAFILSTWNEPQR